MDEKINLDITEWQKAMIDARLKTIEEYPESLLPIELLLSELEY